MRQASWWRHVGRARLAWLGGAAAVALVFLFVVPLAAPFLGQRAAGLLRPAFAMALMGGLLLVAGDALAALHRRYDRTDD